jgi:hypothetical protein
VKFSTTTAFGNLFIRLQAAFKNPFMIPIAGFGKRTELLGLFAKAV